MPVKIQPKIETGPAASGSDDGSRNTPDPTMLPMTRAVAIHKPMLRLSFGFAAVAVSIASPPRGSKLQSRCSFRTALEHRS